jgi:hypothetical protein
MPTVREHWYSLPVVWLGAAILIVSIAGCIGLMLSASHYPDEPVRLSGDEVLHVPVAREPQRSP